MIGGIKVRRNPEKVEPPDRICKKLAEHKRPGLPKAKYFRPAHFCIILRIGLRCITINVSQFCFTQSFLPCRYLIKYSPKQQPYKTQHSGPYKGFPPTIRY